jgi:hypothetical protein
MDNNMQNNTILGPNSGSPTGGHRNMNNSGKPFKYSPKQFVGSNRELSMCVFEPVLEGGGSDRFEKNIEDIKVYVARNFADYASDYTTAIQNRRLDDPAPIEEPTDVNNILAVKKWENQEKKRDKITEAYRQFTYALYMLVMRQCTPAMKESVGVSGRVSCNW